MQVLYNIFIQRKKKSLDAPACDPCTFAAAFGSAVIVKAQTDSWVARKGEFCVFNVLRGVSPKV